MTTQKLSDSQLASLMEENMGLVVKVAKSFCPKTKRDLDEYIQLGRIGMWKAILKHDPQKAALSTLIWLYVKWEIIRGLKNKDSGHVQLDMDFAQNTSFQLSVLDEYFPSCLTEKETKVMNMRLQSHSFSDIGKSLGYSRMWANNTYKSAIKKIQDANT